MNRKSYFNLLIEYNSTLARTEMPEVFPYLEVKYDEPKYPGKVCAAFEDLVLTSLWVLEVFYSR